MNNGFEFCARLTCFGWFPKRFFLTGDCQLFGLLTCGVNDESQFFLRNIFVITDDVASDSFSLVLSDLMTMPFLVTDGGVSLWKPCYRRLEGFPLPAVRRSCVRIFQCDCLFYLIVVGKCRPNFRSFTLLTGNLYIAAVGGEEHH